MCDDEKTTLNPKMTYEQALNKINFLLEEDIAKVELRRSFGDALVNQQEALYLACKDALEKQKTIEELGECYIIPKNGTWMVNGIDVHEALEKQIPQKPIVDRCPKCNELAYEPRNISNELYADTTFCSRCGQAIDWSDDNDE